jgi:hypothetical protein
MKLIELIFKPNQEEAVYAISLVDVPAIEQNFMFFSKEEVPILLKFDEEKQIITGPVLIPGKKMFRTAESLNQKEGAFVFASDATVIRCAQMFLSNLKNNNVTLMHEVPTSGARLIESWIVTDPEHDKSTALGFKDIVKNTWFASYHIDDPKVWQLIKSKKLQGFSIESVFSLGKPTEMPDDENSELMEMMKFLQEIELGWGSEHASVHTINKDASTGKPIDAEKGGPEQVNEPMHKDTTEGEQQGVNPMLTEEEMKMAIATIQKMCDKLKVK